MTIPARLCGFIAAVFDSPAHYGEQGETLPHPSDVFVGNDTKQFFHLPDIAYLLWQDVTGSSRLSIEVFTDIYFMLMDRDSDHSFLAIASAVGTNVHVVMEVYYYCRMGSRDRARGIGVRAMVKSQARAIECSRPDDFYLACELLKGEMVVIDGIEHDGAEMTIKDIGSLLNISYPTLNRILKQYKLRNGRELERIWAKAKRRSTARSNIQQAALTRLKNSDPVAYRANRYVTLCALLTLRGTKEIASQLVQKYPTRWSSDTACQKFVRAVVQSAGVQLAFESTERRTLVLGSIQWALKEVCDVDFPVPPWDREFKDRLSVLTIDTFFERLEKRPYISRPIARLALVRLMLYFGLTVENINWKTDADSVFIEHQKERWLLRVACADLQLTDLLQVRTSVALVSVTM